jgi:hypothetical protein
MMREQARAGSAFTLDAPARPGREARKNDIQIGNSS